MFHGSMVAIVTPMTITGAVDYEALTALIAWHIESGTEAIIAVGTTGESATLTPQEQTAIIRHVVACVNHRVPVIAGSGATGTLMSIERTEAAKNAGADACLLMAPPYIKPTQEGLFLHYQMIAKSVSIPQILYNVPGRTVVDILPETVARLAKIPNIVGIKEATGDLSRVRTLLDLCGDQLDLYSGDDATACDFMLMGGKGVISVTANVAPQQMSLMSHLAIEKATEKAKTIDAMLQPLHQQLFVEANPIPVKWALEQLGRIQAGIRLPLTPLSTQYHATVLEALNYLR
jgi:4-hydroxy-tetrahydrodipicolinate synthase